MHNLSSTQLAKYLEITTRSVQRRAVRESWQFDRQASRGGTTKYYYFSSLPLDIKQQVTASIMRQHQEQAASDVANMPNEPSKQAMEDDYNLQHSAFIVLNKAKNAHWIIQHSFAHELDSTEIDKEYVKVGLIVLARLYLAHFEVGKIKGLDQFCQLYNTRELALAAVVYDIVKRLSCVTLLRWEREIKAKGVTLQLLADNIAPPPTFDLNLQQISERMLLIVPTITAKRLHTYLSNIYGDHQLPSLQLLKLWLTYRKNERVNMNAKIAQQ